MKLKKVLRTIASTACAAVLALSLVSCGHNSSSTSEAGSSSGAASSAGESRSFTIALYSEYAPKTCENFEKLVKDGFYDGLVFHRVMKDFMAQGGGFDENGKPKEAQTIKGEFAANGFTQNTISHKRGIVSMARTAQSMDSASSQFFICYADKDTFLDGQYAAFGKVTQGMDVVDDFLKIELKMTETGEQSVPASTIKITKAEMVEDDGKGHHQAKFYVTF